MTIINTHVHSHKELFRDLWGGNIVNKHPGSEYWTLLPVKDKAYVLIDRLSQREKRRIVLSAAGWVKRDELLREVRNLSETRWLHTATVVVAVGQSFTAGEWWQEFIKLAQAKSLKLQTLFLPYDTADIVARLRAQAATA
jgi:hypothetical protein